MELWPIGASQHPHSCEPANLVPIQQILDSRPHKSCRKHHLHQQEARFNQATFAVGDMFDVKYLTISYHLWDVCTLDSFCVYTAEKLRQQQPPSKENIRSIVQTSSSALETWAMATMILLSKDLSSGDNESNSCFGAAASLYFGGIVAPRTFQMLQEVGRQHPFCHSQCHKTRPNTFQNLP